MAFNAAIKEQAESEPRASEKQVNNKDNSKQQGNSKATSKPTASQRQDHRWPRQQQVKRASASERGPSFPVSRASGLKAVRFAQIIPACVLDYTIIDMVKTNSTRVSVNRGLRRRELESTPAYMSFKNGDWSLRAFNAHSAISRWRPRHLTVVCILKSNLEDCIL